MHQWTVDFGAIDAFGDDIEWPVLRQVIGLARQPGIYLHAQVDSDAIQRIFKHNLDALVLIRQIIGLTWSRTLSGHVNG
jgi:hypothetical protein